jgi:hypothetical protein
VQRGFIPGYEIWTEHGENYFSSSTLEPSFDNAMLAASQEPLHSFTSASWLSTVARLMGIKSQHNMSAECIDNLLRLFGDVLLEGHNMPSNLYECKCLLNGLKMPYVKIDACINNYMLYYKQDEHKDRCVFL